MKTRPTDHEYHACKFTNYAPQPIHTYHKFKPLVVEAFQVGDLQLNVCAEHHTRENVVEVSVNHHGCVMRGSRRRKQGTFYFQRIKPRSATPPSTHCTVRMRIAPEPQMAHDSHFAITSHCTTVHNTAHFFAASPSHEMHNYTAHGSPQHTTTPLSTSPVLGSSSVSSAAPPTALCIGLDTVRHSHFPA